jgi:uncharacterized protein YpuA (DUF1002 family)
VQVEKVGDKTISLNAASSSADTMLLVSDVFPIDCDTLAFVLEVYAADSMWEGSTSVTFSTNPYVTKDKPADSVYMVLKMQEVSPENMVNDTLTFTYLTSVLTKTYAGGRMYQSAKITPANAASGKAKLWVKVHQAYNTVQKIKFRVWSIKKWLK